MKTLTCNAIVASVLGMVVLTGCGGGGSVSVNGSTAQADQVTTIPAAEVVNFVANLQATTSESTEPQDISLINLGEDDAS